MWFEESLKEQASWDILFHELNPPRTLINRLKWFCNQMSFLLRYFKIKDLVLTNTARSWTQRRMGGKGKRVDTVQDGREGEKS